MSQAKLSDARVFLYNEFPKINATVAGEGIILFNFASSHHHLYSEHPIYFRLDSLVKRDFSTLANQVMRWSPIAMVFNSETQDLLARQFSDYFTACFRFNSLAFLQPYLPMLVFVLDIVVDDPPLILQLREPCYQHVDDGDFFYIATDKKTIVADTTSKIIDADDDLLDSDDADDLQDCNTYDLPDSVLHKHIVSKYLNGVIQVQEILESSVDEFYQILAALRSLPLYNTNTSSEVPVSVLVPEASSKFQNIISDEDKDKHKAKHAELAHAIETRVFVKIKPTIQLMAHHPNPQGLREEDCDLDCVICFFKLSEGVEIAKFVRCNHVFHRDCTFKWLSRKQSCPYCRSQTFIELFC